MKTILDHKGGVLTTFHQDGSDPLDHFHVHKTQNVAPLIEANKAWAEDFDPKAHFRPVAEIPEVLANQMMREGWFHDNKKLKKWLNDPDNRAFRIWPGRV